MYHHFSLQFFKILIIVVVVNIFFNIIKIVIMFMHITNIILI